MNSVSSKAHNLLQYTGFKNIHLFAVGLKALPCLAGVDLVSVALHVEF